ncbi:flagellar biosynthesis regulator FlaF [Caulobacter sp. NIBR2454]|uniref:flagellar biosynthesis regulator FlaF n=1 Tax=Caulobacter sp. NIBR2454 TaxID=3015996 RepID=UPI0022B73FAE|nr:flagellar biosynthesis regulator FlaF [Caulobacter sp. NIBR2454]
MSLRAYQQTAISAESPREIEYRIFGEVTRDLMSAASGPADDFNGRMNALDRNRRLWSAFATDCSQPSNQLPPALRAQIISLSLWVARHSSAVMRKEEDFEPLIDINRSIMQGLSQRPGS